MSYRRRGIGTALTLQPLRDALADGYHTGVLQAAAEGVGVYRRVGVERFGNITEYKPTWTDSSSPNKGTCAGR